MKNILKGILIFIIFLFLGYVLYRNIMLHKVPTIDLIKNESTSKLYRMMIPNSENPIWQTYLYNNDVNHKTFKDEIKYNLAYKNTGTSSSTIEEEKIKQSYEKVFGPNTYKQVNTILAGCEEYNYDLASKSYIIKERKTCNKGNITILSRIINAKESKDNFNLTVEIAYLDNSNKTVYRECDKTLKNCSGIIKKDFKEFDEANLSESNYNLHKYTFYYKDQNGNYYFDHNKKIK